MDPFHIIAEHIVFANSNCLNSWLTDFYNYIFTSSAVATTCHVFISYYSAGEIVKKIAFKS